MKFKVKNGNFSTDNQRLKLLFPVTALSFDFFKRSFDFPIICRQQNEMISSRVLFYLISTLHRKGDARNFYSACSGMLVYFHLANLITSRVHNERNLHFSEHFCILTRACAGFENRQVHRSPKCDTHGHFCLIFGNIAIFTNSSTLI